MYIQEVIIKDLLPHRHQLLDQIRLKGGGPCASAGTKPMEGVVALNYHYLAVMQYPDYCIPQTFYQSCTTEGAVTIQDQYYGLPGALLCEVTLTEGILDHTKYLPP